MLRWRCAALLKVVAIVVLVAACQADSALSAFAAAGCRSNDAALAAPLEQWCDCCTQHDIAYWRGGTQEQRVEADQRLQSCLLKRTGDEQLTKRLYSGKTRAMFGKELVPSAGEGQSVSYRWGYGWQSERDYKPLNEHELYTANQLVLAYFKSPQRACF